MDPDALARQPCASIHLQCLDCENDIEKDRLHCQNAKSAFHRRRQSMTVHFGSALPGHDCHYSRSKNGTVGQRTAPRTGFALRTCSNMSSRPPGRRTRYNSFNTLAGSGTEQMVHEVTIVSKDASRKHRPTASACTNRSSPANAPARPRLFSSIALLMSIAVIAGPMGKCRMSSPVPIARKRVLPRIRRKRAFL